MGDYTLEPPRRDLIVHHTFDRVDNDRVVDYSPQAIDGSVVGNVTFGHTGITGQAARMKDEENHVTISGLSEFLPLDETTVSTWGRSERPVPADRVNATATVTVNGTTQTLTHDEDGTVEGWEHALLWFDGTEAVLYYGTEETSLRRVASTDISGSVDSFDVTVFSRGYAYVDDVRVYRTALDIEHVDNLHELALASSGAEFMREEWENDGIPFRGANEQLGGALAESDMETFRQLDAIREARHIRSAAGRQLDRIGAIAGINRKEGESDGKYRARIKATMIASRSDGTFEDILNATASILETDTERVEIQTSFDSDPAEAFVYIRIVDVEDTTLTASEIEDILQNTVVAGHEVTVVEQGSNPFTFIDESMANNPERGLTSDSMSTGGGLVSDL